MPKRRISYLQKVQAMYFWIQGVPFRKLAAYYGVSVNTIRQWHYRGRWAKEKCKFKIDVYLAVHGMGDAKLRKKVAENVANKAEKARRKV